MKRLRLVVLGDIGGCPYGGQTWMFLHWLCGLRALGHDVWYVEDHLWWPYDPEQDTVTDDCAYAVRHVARPRIAIGLADRWAVRLPPRSEACWGLTSQALDTLYRECDALFNVSGTTDLREEHLAAPFRIYIQTDPVTSELRLANGDPHTRWAFDLHHVIVTYGENYRGGRLRGPAERHPVPDDPSARRSPPLADGLHPRRARLHDDRQLSADGEGRRVPGQSLPVEQALRVGEDHRPPGPHDQPFELASTSTPPTVSVWRATAGESSLPFDSPSTSSAPIPAYIRASRGELTVAKDQNVRLRSGWFSERDACYLASGKPVVAQDTGFSNVLPIGEGLFAFTTVEEAVAAVEAINADYPRHAKAARPSPRSTSTPPVARRLLQAVGLA